VGLRWSYSAALDIQVMKHLRLMNPFGKIAIHVLTIMLFVSSGIGAEMPCEAQGAVMTDNVVASHGTEHAQHGDVAGPDDCPCCDDCAMVCAGMGVSALAGVSISSELPYDVRARLLAPTVNFRPQPPPRSLFRPPIS